MDAFLSPGVPAEDDDDDDDDDYVGSSDKAPVIHLPEDDDVNDFAPSPGRSEGDGREDPDGTDG